MAELSLRTTWHIRDSMCCTWFAHDCARCVARDLHTIAPGPLERTCWRQFAFECDDDDSDDDDDDNDDDDDDDNGDGDDDDNDDDDCYHYRY